jgi:bisphosphoglycerate-independent phosphoglycerate mutase (AlkP superfamily)
MAGAGIEATGEAETMSLLDVAPTVLELMGLEPLPGMRGTNLLRADAELSRPR